MQKESPILYYVEKEYLKYLHKEDYRVSVKFNNRPFAGIVTSVGDKKYMIPVTNQRYDTKSHNFSFLKKTCCDFKKLETALEQYGKEDNGSKQ